MGGKGKLKKVSGNPGKRIGLSPDLTPNLDIAHPVFCLRYLNKHYHINKCESKEKVALLTRMQKLSTMTWAEIRAADRHGFGAEKINQDSIKAGLPDHVTKDEVLLALRFDGKKPMVGVKNAFVFHIFYIDRDFTLYDH